MKKILIAENQDKAEAFIEEIEKVYLPELRRVHSELLSLGLQINKTELVEVIDGNFESIRSRYRDITQADFNTFRSPAAQAQMRSVVENGLEDICRTIPARFSSKLIDDKPLSDHYFQELVYLDDSGNFFIPEEIKLQIFENFKEYLTDPKLQKVYTAHRDTAEAIQRFMDALIEAKMDMGLVFGISAPWPFLSVSFTMSKEGERFVIEPRKLKYNMASE